MQCVRTAVVSSKMGKVLLDNPNVLKTSVRGIGCNSLEGQTEKTVSCRRPDIRGKIRAYTYGYCKEPDVPMRMSCPPKVKKRGRGPCCHEARETKKGGCKVNV